MSVTIKWKLKHLIPMVMKMEGFLFPWNIFISLFYASWKYQLCLRCFSENSLGEIKENYYISIHTAIKVMQITHNSSDSALKNLLRNVGVNDIYLFIYF